MRKDRPCILRVEDVTMQFGGVVAVNNFSMEEYEGEIVAIIGPNGAGKTTAFNVITGVYAPTNGRVSFNGERVIENYPHGKMKKSYLGQNAGKYDKTLEPTPDKLTALGMARTFQNIRLWKSMSVFDNVLIAKHMKRSSNLFSATFGMNHAEEQRHERLALARDGFPGRQPDGDGPLLHCFGIKIQRLRRPAPHGVFDHRREEQAVEEKLDYNFHGHALS